MKSTVTELEDNKVKLSVEIDAADFEPEVDAAFKRLAKEVRLPGFRPGKAPRKLLEARMGDGYAREDALREALPSYYSEAVRDNDVDVIDSPEIDVTSGQESGDVTFDAVVEVRPRIVVAGYKGLKVVVTAPALTDQEVHDQIDRIRLPHAELQEVDRPLVADDHALIDIASTLGGEELPGLTTSDYDYVVGSNAVGIDEIDENLLGASTGDTVEFSAEHPDPEEDREIEFVITVTAVKESILPELDDAFVAENTEFDSVDALKADIDIQVGNAKRESTAAMVNDKTAEALAALVTDEISDALINNEMQNSIQEMSAQFQRQGFSLEQYLEMTGTEPEEFTEQLREGAEQSAKVDLALRAIVVAEKIEITEDLLNEELERVGEAFGQDSEAIREQLESAGQLKAIRSDLQIRKALEVLTDSVEIVDEDGNSIDRSDLEIIEVELDEDEALEEE